MEGVKVTKWGEDFFSLLFFFYFSNHWNLFCIYQNGNFLPWKIISHREKIRKNDFAPSKKYSSYAPAHRGYKDSDINLSCVPYYHKSLEYIFQAKSKSGKWKIWSSSLYYKKKILLPNKGELIKSTIDWSSILSLTYI